MYEAFYGLDEKPFNLTPDPRFLFLSNKHKEAFAHLLYGIKNRTGFIMVSGEVGTGKTTICRSLLNQLDPDIEVAFIFNPFLSPEELLRKINEDFGILSQGRTVKELIDELNEYLLDRNALGKNCVLVIDEAQDLSPTVLEQIRLLSNLETETQKLLQIVLIGQPELAENLQLPQLRQLNQRITARYHLRPLDAKETLQYIAYRLSTAGGRGQVRFTRSAIKSVFKASGGTPRVINAICDRALLIGYTRELRDITAALVREAAREIRGATLKKKTELRPLLWKYGLPSATVVVTVAVVMLLVKVIEPFDSPQPRVMPLAKAEPAGPEILLTPLPLPEPPTESAEPDASPVELLLLSEPAKPDPEPTVSGPEKPQALGDVLKALDPIEARNAALAGILSAWNMAVVAGYPEGDEPATLAKYGSTNGLASETLTPALDQLTAIGLPALARMQAGGESRWVALTKVKDGTFTITADGTGKVEVPRDEFREHYAGEAIVFWRDPAPDAPVMSRHSRGPQVVQLKRNLRALSRLNGPATGEYDEETARAVARLQAETGLAVDGIAGKQVRMVMSSWLPAEPTPALTGKERPKPPRPPAPEPVMAAKEPPKPESEPEPKPEAVAKQEDSQPAVPELEKNYNTLPGLPFDPLLNELPLAAPPQESAKETPAVAVEPLPAEPPPDFSPAAAPQEATPPEGIPPDGIPPMPRLPGISAAPDAGHNAPEAVADEFHS